jgi:hypothetical protein
LNILTNAVVLLQQIKNIIGYLKIIPSFCLLAQDKPHKNRGKRQNNLYNHCSAAFILTI